MVNDILEYAVNLIKSGDIDEGGKILVGLLKENQQIERAWAWLYICVKTDEERIYCLNNVIDLNPKNEKAKATLEKLTEQQTSQLSIQSEFTEILAQNSPVQMTEQILEPEQPAKVDEAQATKLDKIKDVFAKSNKTPHTKTKYSRSAFPDIDKILKLNPNHERADATPEKLTGQQTSQLPIQSEATEILAQNIAVQTTEQGQESKPIAKEDDVQDSRSNKFKVVFVKPKIIFNKPDENPYAKTKYASSDFPDVDTAMYGNTLAIGGIYINTHDYPKCISAGHTLPKSLCYICEFFSAEDCPIRRNSTILDEVQFFFAQYKRYWQEDQDRRDSKIDAIYSELKAHGRPLHYEVIARIIKDRYPKLRLNANMVLHFMMRHPEKFEWGDIGVYKTK